VFSVIASLLPSGVFFYIGQYGGIDEEGDSPTTSTSRRGTFKALRTTDLTLSPANSSQLVIQARSASSSRRQPLPVNCATCVGWSCGDSFFRVRVGPPDGAVDLGKVRLMLDRKHLGRDARTFLPLRRRLCRARLRPGATPIVVLEWRPRDYRADQTPFPTQMA